MRQLGMTQTCGVDSSGHEATAIMHRYGQIQLFEEDLEVTKMQLCLGKKSEKVYIGRDMVHVLIS